MYGQEAELSIPGGQVDALHVDGAELYWAAQGGALQVGSTDGARKPEEIGRFTSLLGASIATDATHVWWHDGSSIRRRPKEGGDVETIALPSHYGSGDLALDDEHLYVAMPGCPAITRIDRVTLARDTVFTEVIEDIRSGSAHVEVDGGEVFCGSWGSIYRFSSWDEPAEKLVHLGEVQRIWDIIVLGDDVYWLASPGPEGRISIGRVARVGGKAEAYVTDAIGGQASEGLLHDAGRSFLYFLAADWIVTFSLSTHEYALRVLDHLSLSLASDGEFLYWAEDFKIRRHPTIARMRLDAVPSPIQVYVPREVDPTALSGRLPSRE